MTKTTFIITIFIYLVLIALILIMNADIRRIERNNVNQMQRIEDLIREEAPEFSDGLMEARHRQ